MSHAYHLQLAVNHMVTCMQLHMHSTEWLLSVGLIQEKVMAAVGNAPISGDSKQTTAALQLSSRLKNWWKTDFDWTLVPTAVKEVDV